VVIRDEGGNPGTNNINGAASRVVSTGYGRVTLRYSGTAWFGG
jgi:hypothetical protein